MSDFNTEKEALKSVRDSRDVLIEALYNKIGQLSYMLIELGGGMDHLENRVGIRVVDRHGNSHEYPDASGSRIEPHTEALLVYRADEITDRPVAVFRSGDWTFAERMISKS